MQIVCSKVGWLQVGGFLVLPRRSSASKEKNEEDERKNPEENQDEYTDAKTAHKRHIFTNAPFPLLFDCFTFKTNHITSFDASNHPSTLFRQSVTQYKKFWWSSI